jgi:hypothetical protein
VLHELGRLLDRVPEPKREVFLAVAYLRSHEQSESVLKVKTRGDPSMRNGSEPLLACTSLIHALLNIDFQNRIFRGVGIKVVPLTDGLLGLVASEPQCRRNPKKGGAVRAD